jgi:hypothetical protein
MTSPERDAELAELRTLIQTVAEAVSTLTVALERLPTEEPDEAERRLERGVRRAHELLLAVRESPAGQSR